jgi:plastocyanin
LGTRIIFVVAVALSALAATAAGNAATWKVAAGEQARPPAGVPKHATIDKFMPKRLVISAGDSVTFSSASFHTVTYLFRQRPPALFVPDPAKGAYDDINDQEGSPFHFNGLPKLIYNPLAFAPIGGKQIAGTAPVSSGVLAPAGPKVKFGLATYRFPKTGSFKLVCNVHPGMDMSVVVKPAGSPPPASPSQVQAAILAQQEVSWTEAKKLAALKPPARTVYAGVGSGTALLDFLPKDLRVKAGTTVRFVNKSPSEVHNVAFGPSKWIQAFLKKTDLLPMGPKAPNQVTPVFPYGSEPKGEFVFDGSNHGNGFLATPLNAGSPKVPLPKVATVTFTKAGTYKYVCLIHAPGMAGRVIVTP